MPAHASQLVPALCRQLLLTLGTTGMPAQQLANVADVTMEIDAGTVDNAPVVLQQMTDLLVNNTISVAAACNPLAAPLMLDAHAHVFPVQLLGCCLTFHASCPCAWHACLRGTRDTWLVDRCKCWQACMQAHPGPPAEEPVLACVRPQVTLQQHGLTNWGIQLLAIATVAPSAPGQAPLPCQSPFAGLCLDGGLLTPAALTMIIAFCCAIVVLTVIALFVYREVRKRSGQVRAFCSRHAL
jgi:hypothetical protein